jgi:hypothetical protein
MASEIACVVFQQRPPNNSTPILHADHSRWAGLFHRSIDMIEHSYIPEEWERSGLHILCAAGQTLAGCGFLQF